MATRAPDNLERLTIALSAFCIAISTAMAVVS